MKISNRENKHGMNRPIKLSKGLYADAIAILSLEQLKGGGLTTPNEFPW